MTIYYNTKQSVAAKVIAKPPQLAVAAAAAAVAVRSGDCGSKFYTQPSRDLCIKRKTLNYSKQTTKSSVELVNVLSCNSLRSFQLMGCFRLPDLRVKDVLFLV